MIQLSNVLYILILKRDCYTSEELSLILTECAWNLTSGKGDSWGLLVSQSKHMSEPHFHLKNVKLWHSHTCAQIPSYLCKSKHMCTHHYLKREVNRSQGNSLIYLRKLKRTNTKARRKGL